MCSSLFFVLFSSFSLFFSGSVKTQILVKCFFSRTVYIIFFALTTKKVFSEIRTIRIFHHFTDKSALNVQIRPHYYTVFPAFPQQILSRKRFLSSYRRTFYQVFRIFVKSRNLKNQGFLQNDLIIFQFYRHGIQENPIPKPVQHQTVYHERRAFRSSAFCVGNMK